MASPATPPATPPPTSSGRPASPSPSRSGLRTLTRMSTMLRRNSSGFSLGRKSLDRSTSKESLRGKKEPSNEVAPPSPVPESPAREAQANAAEVFHPPVKSPLTKEVTDSPVPVTQPLVAEPEPIVETPPKPAESVTVADTPASKPAEPAAPIPAPVAPVLPVVAPAPIFPVVAPAPIAAPSPVPVPVPAPEPAPEKRVTVVSPSEEGNGTPAPLAPLSDISPAPEERAADYFAWGNVPEPIKKPSTSTLATNNSAPAPTSVNVSAAPSRSRSLIGTPVRVPIPIPDPPAPEPPAPAPAPPLQSAPVDPYAASAADSFAWKDDGLSSKAIGKRPSRDIIHSSPEPMHAHISRSPSRERPVASPPSVARSLSPKASKSSIASSYGQVVPATPGRRRVSVSVDPEEPRRGRSRSRGTTSIRISFDEDPFADPPPTTMPGSQALSPVYSVNTPAVEEPYPVTEEPESMPESAVAEEPSTVTYPYHEQATPEKLPTPVSMPLPALNEVTTSRTIREQPSAYSIGQSTVGPVDLMPRETDERLPLLPRGMPVPDVSTSKAPTSPPVFNDIDITIHQNSRTIAWPSIDRGYKALGWSEHVLPDNSIYYSHHDLHVVTEVDLRNPKKLQGVAEYIDRKRPNEVVLPPQGWELWLRDGSKVPFEFVPVRAWVSHKDRVLTLEAPSAPAGEAAIGLSEDERINQEYQYWTYVESHPAHEPLSGNAHAEALDALTWCYTDCLLPSERTIPPAFSPQECQELMALLRSDANSSPSNTIVRNRIVARVLLRQAQWRQHYFRPSKPLPSGFTKGPAQVSRRITFRRALLDVIMSILCLGIPYLFMDRQSHHRMDEESGLHSKGPVLIISACACLVAAVILSASVTLLTLPGLDDLARLAGMIAILFSASSMVSSVIALFKFKAALDRTVVYVGGEGLMILSRRSIVMSLPVVFLAWAVAAFITGITFYSFRGVTLTSKAIIAQPFVDYTHWAVVGGLGGLAGILLVTIFVAGRK